MVGCVIVHDGHIISEGAHLSYGGKHAEILALEHTPKITSESLNIKMYVTLEPCCHFGKTPPCCEQIIESKITDVIYLLPDPNPLIAGKGIDSLKKEGISIRQLQSVELQSKYIELNKGYFHRFDYKRPWVVLKQAITLDGKIADCTNNSKWISCDHSRRDVHHIRAMSDAVLTSIKTIKQDDCKLTVRELPKSIDIGLHEIKQPVCVILDSSLFISEVDNIIKFQAKIIVYTLKKENEIPKYLLKLQNLLIVKAPSINGKINLTFIVEDLSKRNINYLLVECGADLAGGFFKEDLVDEYITYISPKPLGNHSKSSVWFDQIRTLQNCLHFSLDHTSPSGNDIKAVWKPIRPEIRKL